MRLNQPLLCLKITSMLYSSFRNGNLIPYIIERCRLIIARRTCGAVDPSKLIEKTKTQAIWEVLIPGRESVFMYAESGYINEKLFVIHVDTEKFYRMWFKDSSPWNLYVTNACPIRSTMYRDYKYGEAIVGFSHGLENPVPLADIGSLAHIHRENITFTNGVTRTMWLISNHAPSFPVAVSNEHDARFLNKHFGLTPNPISFVELFGRKV